MHHDWYDLFSRGARDWLRHNDKVREAVRQHLPEVLSGPELMTGAGRHGVQVPLKLLEHARFRLSSEHSTTGAGQGPGQPGDILRSPWFDEDDNGAGNDGGDITLLMEFSVDEIMDWLWEDLQLPQLKPRGNSALDDAQLVRKGWDKRGARSRLDRRRTVKEAVKRRAVQPQLPPFTNDDLRFRQLLEHPRPGNRAVLFFMLDVSSSMTVAERQLAKTFFFLALHGLRRKYHRVDTRFLAHAAEAWEFSEADFFQISGMGGTMASTGFQLALELLRQRYDAAGWNSYLFYASDGDNFAEDRAACETLLGAMATQLNHMAYVETLPGMPRMQDSEMGRLWKQHEHQGLPMSSAVLANGDDVFTAIRQFLMQQAAT
ncbi:hypothetical protein FHW58_001241 [Duganella sp. 1224]|uniref:DUF444 family protein n=1 Tax=Duganella sp. 1224 TaxID=2587052 RepID=UPI0015CB0289|nr:DUF444 family protein [Duganella sp. 1224]NYE60089.1 hypothetical protein [Duganella sp. 1224]